MGQNWEEIKKVFLKIYPVQLTFIELGQDFHRVTRKEGKPYVINLSVFINPPQSVIRPKEEHRVYLTRVTAMKVLLAFPLPLC